MNTSKVDVCGPSGFRYGTAVFTPGKGWRFLPSLAARRPSSKYHETSEASIPRWARSGSREGVMVAGSVSPVEVSVKFRSAQNHKDK